MKTKLEGIWVALWTPTDAQGRLLLEPLKEHLSFLLDKGVDGFALAGSTGQFPYLDVACRQQLLDTVIDHVGGRRVMVHLSAMRPLDVISLAQHASQKDVAAVMLQPPSYYPFAQQDIVHYLVTMAMKANRPLVLYNYPECTRNKLELETIRQVSAQVPVLGIKQSGSEFAYHNALIQLGQEVGFSVLTGADSRLAEALSLGVAGSIGGLANGIPELMVDVYRAYTEGRQEACVAATAKVGGVARRIGRMSFPLNIAALMQARGLAIGVQKEIVSDATQQDYAKLIDELKVSKVSL